MQTKNSPNASQLRQDDEHSNNAKQIRFGIPLSCFHGLYRLGRAETSSRLC